MAGTEEEVKSAKKRKPRQKIEVIDLDGEPPAKKTRTKKKRSSKEKANKDEETKSKKRKTRKKKDKSKAESPEIINLADEELTEADKQAILQAQQELTADEPVDLRECASCSDWLPVCEMYFLDMCSHRYCKPCWSKCCGTFTRENTSDPMCKICQGIVTQNDIMFGLSVKEYLKYQATSKARVEEIRKKGHKQKCANCSTTFQSNALRLLPQLQDDGLRKSLSEIPPANIISIFEEVESALAITCKSCNSKICSICGKLSGMENGHSAYVCNIIPSLIISEILEELEIAHGWNIQSVPGSKNNSKNSSKHTKKKKSTSTAPKTKNSGVGFAGSQSDNYKAVETAQKKENEEREVVSQLMKILSFFFPSDISYQPHCSLFPIVKESCLLRALTMYFRNDWLMDTNAIDSDLYFSVLAIIRALSLHRVMFGIIMTPVDDSGNDSLRTFLQALNKQTEFFMKKVETFGSQEGSQVTHVLGLSLDIQSLFGQVEDFAAIWNTGKLSEYLLAKPNSNAESEEGKASRIGILKKKKTKKKSKLSSNPVDELEKRYIQAMRPLQFEFQNPFPTSLQNVPYLADFARVKQQSVTSPQVIIRISQELSSLATSLPLSINSGVFMRVNEEKVNEIRFIIIGPAGTPYENGCFEFEMVIGYDYPSHPPHVQIMTTGGGSVRFNPNLYNNGKVCLSLLGTWSGPGWDPNVSTLLQVLVSIQSLIMVPDPYFNEPGYESSRGSFAGNRSSENYNQNIRLRTMEQAMVAQLQRPTPGFEEVIRTHFFIKKQQILEQCRDWKKRGGSKFNTAMKQLEDELAQLAEPLSCQEIK